MSEQNGITVDELEQAFSLILEGFRRDTKFIEVSDDYYWKSLNESEIYDVHTEPKTFGIGQISEDVHFLRSALSEKTTLSMYLLFKLLPILQNYVDRNFGVVLNDNISEDA